jgi:hypothetical protein
MMIKFTRDRVDRTIKLAENLILKAETVGEVQGRSRRTCQGPPAATSRGAPRDGAPEDAGGDQR